MSLPPVGSLWRHYKGAVYVVGSYGRYEPSGELMVGYLPADGEYDGVPWMRALSVWFEEVELPDRRKVPRFERVEL